MGAFGVMIGMLHYAGLYVQINTAFKTVGFGEVDNYLTGNAIFTEVPHDTTTQSGEDVEMACSFRGAGAPSYSLEIQWWYSRKHGSWQQQQEEEEEEERRPGQIISTNQVVPLEQMSKDATKISVVKVAGSNISHKLRLSSVKPSDEGTYECRVIDFSGSVPQHHRAHAYLRVEPHRPGLRSADRDQTSRAQQTSRHQAAGGHLHAHPGHQVAGKELNRKEAVGGGGGCGEDCKVL
ncbi:V-set and transmembrane domain-containing protein 2-like protein [Gadus macrocephalus]|uniref:V-set and transmembrane domain-containing protein 2-like protein n=1 Tax=Gadus macrocephalus TaxID=80720 RepID=UPI0028CB96D4|nr:V-set and transmembrane domain-containing protein 2-like protein [Gadus macrocephalus]